MAKKKEIKNDSWINVATQIGTSRDKRKYGSFEGVKVVTETMATALWEGDDIAAKAIEKGPMTMLRNGFTVSVSGDMNIEAALKSKLDDISANYSILDAVMFSRAFGGSAIFVGVDDGQEDISQPIRESTLKGVRYLHVLKPSEVRPSKLNDEKGSANFGMPEVFEVSMNASRFSVHASRMICFTGQRFGRRGAGNFWGRSVLDRIHEVIRDFHTSYSAIPILVSNFSQFVYEMKGLAELMAAGQEDIVVNRMKAVDLSRSIVNALIVDAEDKVSTLQMPVNGLSDLIDRMTNRLASAVDMPVSLLLGTSPAGLNATGDANTRWWYDEQEANRERIRSKINHLVRLILISSESPANGKEPEHWTVNFPPLWVATEAERSKIRNEQANTDKAYVDAGILTPEEVALNRFGGDGWNPETKIDVESRSFVSAPSIEPK